MTASWSGSTRSWTSPPNTGTACFSCSSTTAGAPTARIGPQPEPLPGVHNSRWLQSPTREVKRRWSRADRERLEGYATGIVRALMDHPAVLGWDLFNEPGAGHSNDLFQEEAGGTPVRDDTILPSAERLLHAAFAWVRSVDPPQPLTASVWRDDPDLVDLNRYQAASSDVLSLHHYGPVEAIDGVVRLARGGAQGHEPFRDSAGRPLLCTEYMQRTGGNTFAQNLPELKRGASVRSTGASSTVGRRRSSPGTARRTRPSRSPGTTRCCTATARRTTMRRRG